MTYASTSNADAVSESMRAGWQLPATLYSDPSVHEQERERIFSRTWQYVGRERDLATAGDYLTTRLGDLPIVVVRDRDGRLHGHVNVCRHRLHPVAEGAGCRQLFQCRYHGWTYTHDGSLRSAPGLQDEDAFDRQTLGLRPVQVDTYRGFVFANPDVETPPLREYLGGAYSMADELGLDYADWEFGGTYTYDIAANWKLFTENALECYHCPLVHQDTYAIAFHTTKKDYICTEFDNAAIQVAPVTEQTEGLAAQHGLAGFRLLYLWPVTFLSVDDFVGMIARTVPTGPRSCQFIVDTFVKPGTDPKVLERWLDIYDRTFNEDKKVVTAQQAGYNSGSVPQGRLMRNCETTIAMFQHRTWLGLNDSQTAPPRPPTIPRRQQQPAETAVLVETVTEEADDVVSLTLKPEPGESLPPWRPGAHIDLCLDNGLTRQYSLCGDPRDSGHWTVAVLKETSSRGGSAFVHEHVRAGNRLRVRGPRNHFTLPERDAYLFVAGGIGITPILPMIDEAEHSGADWRLLYGGRTRSSMAFLDRLTRHGGKVTIAPQDTHGLLDLTSFLANARAGTAVMACGPAPLLAALTQSCHGREDLTLHTERFTAPDRGNLVNTAFDVVLARTGDVIHVSEQHTVLSALREHGVSASSSCGEGLCGTCETPVLAGEPEHRDTVLTDEERQRGDTMMICVSRSAGDRLVLDL